MKFRTLGRTGLQVSEVGFGAWAIGGDSYGKTEDAESLKAVLYAYEQGVNFFDTADIYGKGRSETLVGKALKGRRLEVFIATKGGWDFYHGGVKQNFTKDYLIFACEESLKRLGTDYIDLYQVHNPNLELIEQGTFFGALEALKREGKIRFYGVSIHVPGEGIQVIQNGRADSIQLIYNLMDQRPEAEVFPQAKKKHIGVIAREPFACGLLTGKYDGNVVFEGPDHRKRWSREKIKTDLEKLDRIKQLLQGKKASLPQLALEFTLSHEAVSVVIPGAKTSAQVLENVSASERSDLSYHDLEQIRRLYQSEEIFQTGFFRN